LKDIMANYTTTLPDGVNPESVQPLGAAGAPQRGAQVEADGSRSEPQTVSDGGLPLPQNLGADNELLEDVAPRLVNALRELVVMYRQEGLVARRHEIRRIRQARLFWQGLQYSWWNSQDMNWHLPWESKIYDDSALEDMPRYQFVTNWYQAFGLSFVSLISQDVPATRFYPQSTLTEADITTAKAASEVATLIEQNNHVEKLLTGAGFYLWTDGKIGGYVRYVADGQRFGWRDELVLTERWVPLGRDKHVCPQCGEEAEMDTPQWFGGDTSLSDLISGTPVSGGTASGGQGNSSNGSLGKDQAFVPAPLSNDSFVPAPSANQPFASAPATDDSGGQSFLSGVICPKCGTALGEPDFHRAPRVPVPIGISTRRVPNGQEVISIVGGLELNTPVWANEQYEFPYLQWQLEVHRAKLKAAFPHVADKIQMGGEAGADDVYARATRVAVAQGMPSTLPGDALFNLVTFSRTWIRPWAFYAIQDAAVRDALLQLFPDGC
jgi:hypothetical protein